MSYRYSLILIAFLLTACDAVSSPAIAPTPTLSARIAGADAQATAIHQAAVSADQTDASNAAYTATERAQRSNASAATQATLDAGYIAEQNARVDAAQTEAQRIHNSADLQATIESASAISATYAMTSSIVIQSVEVSKARHSDEIGYQFIDWIYYSMPRLGIGLGLVIIILIMVYRFLHRVGDAVAAALEDRIYPRQKALPPPHDDDDDDRGNAMETGNRVTGNSSVTRSGNTSERSEMTLNSAQGSGTLHDYTDSQWEQLQTTKSDALELIRRSMEYHRSRGVIDTGEIPRYNHINCKPEWRGAIVDNLVASRLATKGPKGTFVTHEGGETLRELYHRITRNDKRVYPVGFNQLPPEPLDQLAIAIRKAIPIRQRSAD